MILVPLGWLEGLCRVGLWKRPDFLAQDRSDAPSDVELRQGLLIREVRGGYPKWAHFFCPKCSEGIHIPIAGPDRWTLTIDFLRRPTLSPSIWQTGSCGAHFFLRHGQILWCN
jgi:hypothetical protein